MAKKYILLGQLSIAYKLLDFVNNELLPGTNVTKENFWSGLDKCAHELAPKNRKLLEFRENLQKKIDIWHRDRKGEKFDINKYIEFLKKIDYLKKPGPDFKIKTKKCGQRNIKNLRPSISSANLKCAICIKCF